jgi:hypothetical protein
MRNQTESQTKTIIEGLQIQNISLQAQLCQLLPADLANKENTKSNKILCKSEDFSNEDIGKFVERLYKKRLLAHKGIVDTSKEEKYDFESNAKELEKQLDQREAKAINIYDGLKDFEHSLAANAIDSKSGKRLPQENFEHWIKKEEDQQEKLEVERLKHSMLLKLVQRAETSLHSKIQNDGKTSSKKANTNSHLLSNMDFDHVKEEIQKLKHTVEKQTHWLELAKQRRQEAICTNAHVSEKLTCLKNQTSSLNHKIDCTKEKMLTMSKQQAYLNKKIQKAAQEQRITSLKIPDFTKEMLSVNFEENREMLEEVKAEVLRLKRKYKAFSKDKVTQNDNIQEYRRFLDRQQPSPLDMLLYRTHVDG